jgi:hypothetical protein
MPYPLWYDTDNRMVGNWSAEKEGWVDPRLRLNGVLWHRHGYDSTEARGRNARQHQPKDLWEWTEEELREEELEAIERIMQTPPVPLSRIGKTHGRHGLSWTRAIVMGGW